MSAFQPDFGSVRAPKVEDFDASSLADLAGRHAGQRCFIIGNGPSLNRTEVGLLAGEVTFGVNGIFLLTEACGFAPTYYVVEDNHVIEDDLDRIRNVEAVHRFFPSRYQPVIEPAPDVRFLRTDWQFYWENSPYAGIPRFSHDLAEVVYVGQTVTYMNLQLAAYLGFSEIYLVGVDMDYSIPEDAPVENNTITSTSADPNHFHPDYFGPGKRWHFPRLDRVQLSMIKVREVSESRGFAVYNATRGGKLESFERVDYLDLFESPGELASANGPIVTPIVAGLRTAPGASRVRRVVTWEGASESGVPALEREAERLGIDVAKDVAGTEHDLLYAPSDAVTNGVQRALLDGAGVLASLDDDAKVVSVLIDAVTNGQAATWNRGLLELSPDDRFVTAPRFDAERLLWLDAADEATDATAASVGGRAHPVWWEVSSLTADRMRTLVSDLVSARCGVTHQRGYLYAQSRWGSPFEPSSAPILAQGAHT